MALIKCPECGRENVSDSAVACPDCGFGLKEHFEQIQKQKEEERRKEEQQKIKEQYEQRRLNNVKKPDEPSKMNTATVLGIIFIVVGLMSCVVPDLIIGGIVLIGFAIWMFAEGSKQYDREYEKYKLAMEDFEAYQKQVIAEEDRIKALKEIREASAIKCPVCGSTNTEKISTTDRAVSVAMVGVASGKIGKQYKCKKCKHMW